MEQLERHTTRTAETATGPYRPDAAGRDAGRSGGLLLAGRAVASVLIVATGAIHLHLYQDGFSSIPTIGRLFLANGVVAVVLGVALLVRGRPIWSLLGAGFCLTTLAAFLISVHWGLFGYQERLHGAWQERAAAVELAGAAVAGLVTIALLGGRRPGRR
jgi:hypothetical protein